MTQSRVGGYIYDAPKPVTHRYLTKALPASSLIVFLNLIGLLDGNWQLAKLAGRQTLSPMVAAVRQGCSPSYSPMVTRPEKND